MNIVPICAPIKGSAEALHKLADDVGAGIVTGVVVAYVRDGEYVFVYDDSKNSCLIMSTMLHQNCIDRLRT